MKELSEKIIENIVEKKIQPVARWRFVMNEALYRAATFLALLLGGLSLGLSIYLLQSLDWDVYSVLGYGSLHSFIMGAFPYLYVSFVLLSLIGAYFFWRHTKKGYKLRFGALVVLLLIFMGSFAFLYHIFGANERVYLAMENSVHMRPFLYGRENQWLDPERGLLWGEVENVSLQFFMLHDIDQKEWRIEYGSGISEGERLGEESVRKNIKIVGHAIGKDVFLAESIGNWDGVMNCNGEPSSAENEANMPEMGDMMGGKMMQQIR